MIILVISLALNMVQLDKDVLRCKRADWKPNSCSLYVKLNMHK